MTGAEQRPVVGVGVVVVADDRILLIQRGRDPGRGLWTVPGGKVRFGETLRQTALRETREETGLEVEVGDVAWVGEIIDSGHHIVINDFFATVTGGTLRAGDDAADAAWVDLDRVGDLALTGTMRQLLDTLSP
jgi:8-oxo-dGTP diphosphatase